MITGAALIRDGRLGMADNFRDELTVAEDRETGAALLMSVNKRCLPAWKQQILVRRII